MSHVINRRGRTETYPNPTRSTGSAEGLIQWGVDTVQESVQMDATTDPAVAAQLPPLPRNQAGDPLSVTFSEWTSGDILRVRWSGSGGGNLSEGALGSLVPRVIIDGGDPQYIDNGMQIGLLGLGNFTYSFGECVVPIESSGPVEVQLGVLLLSEDAEDFLIAVGGPISLASDPPVTASTWLIAERFSPASLVPSAVGTLMDIPIPTAPEE